MPTINQLVRKGRKKQFKKNMKQSKEYCDKCRREIFPDLFNRNRRTWWWRKHKQTNES